MSKRIVVSKDSLPARIARKELLRELNAQIVGEISFKIRRADDGTVAEMILVVPDAIPNNDVIRVVSSHNPEYDDGERAFPSLAERLEDIETRLTALEGQ